MRIATGISTAKRIDPTTQPMGKFTYAWAMSLAGENTGTAWDGTDAADAIQFPDKWNFSKNSDGFNYEIKDSQTGNGGKLYFTPTAGSGFLKDTPDGVTSNDPSVAGSTPKAGIFSANRYMGMVITFATGSDFPGSGTNLRITPYIGEPPDGTTPPSTWGSFGIFGPGSGTNPGKVAYVNGLKVSEDDGTLVYSNRNNMGLLTDGTASTEKGIPLTLVWDLNRDPNWSAEIVPDTTLLGRWLELVGITDVSVNLNFTIHGFFVSNSDPTRMKFNSSDLPISLTRATGKD